MVAKVEIQITVDGLFYKVNRGEAIPPALAAYWKAANLEAAVKAAGMVEEPARAPTAPAASAKRETA